MVQRYQCGRQSLEALWRLYPVSATRAQEKQGQRCLRQRGQNALGAEDVDPALRYGVARGPTCHRGNRSPAAHLVEHAGAGHTVAARYHPGHRLSMGFPVSMTRPQYRRQRVRRRRIICSTPHQDWGPLRAYPETGPTAATRVVWDSNRPSPAPQGVVCTS